MLLIHLVAVSALAGLGWTVQAVVYPAFALVGPGEWTRYHAAHSRRITWVVGPPWLVQGVTTVGLLVDRHDGWSVVLALLAAVTVAVTALAAVPEHRGLTEKPQDLRKLLRANLVRTLAWTASAVLAALLL